MKLNLTLILVILLGCNNVELSSIEDKVPTMAVDCDNCSVKSNLSEMFDPLSFVVLETKKECLIESIDKISIHKNKIYILDTKGAKSLLVFATDGRYLYKIGKVGNGPGEYVKPYDFNVDLKNNEVKILTHKKLLIYDLGGQYRRTLWYGFSARQFASMENRNECFYGAGKNDKIIIANSKGRVKNSLFPYSLRNRIVTPYGLQKSDSLCLYNIPNCDTIFSVSGNSIVPYLYIDFGHAAFTWKDYCSLGQNQKQQTHAYVVESGKYAFKCLYTECPEYKFLSFVLKKKMIGCFQSERSGFQIYYDVSSCCDDIWFSNVFALPSYIGEDGYVVCIQNFPEEIIKGRQILQNKKQNTGLSQNENEGLKILNDIVSKIDELSNPVLFIAKPKI
ncbi:6-bladed beta-propeller [Puteibacter caeruleilacunae]|nr:6-bladed beta-propeller [Puteibacter caeruleilacunae]